MKFAIPPSMLMLALCIGHVHAQQHEVVGEKGIIGEKSRGARQAPALAIPADISRLLQQPGATVRFRPAAAKLRQLPPDVLAAQPAAADLGVPFRIEPATLPQSSRRWYASNVADVASGMDRVDLSNDATSPGKAGRFGLVFAVQPGYRYLVDCAVGRASEFTVSHTGLGPAANEARVSANGGLVSLVSAPVRAAGNAWVEFKATRTQSAAWDWRGCEITPLRSA